MEQKEQRLNFFTIFRQHEDGSIEPIRSVRIGGVQMSPGVRFGQGVSFGGINLFDFIGKDFSAVEESGVLILTGIYAEN